MNIYIWKKILKIIKKVFISFNNNVWVIFVEFDYWVKLKKIYVIYI